MVEPEDALNANLTGGIYDNNFDLSLTWLYNATRVRIFIIGERKF